MKFIKPAAAAAALICLSSALGAHEDEKKAPEASIDVSTQFASNNVFRGADQFATNAQQNRTSYGSNTGAWMWNPSITWHTPIEGLYFNWTGSFAMEHREDKDIDQRIQSGKGVTDDASNTLFTSFGSNLFGGATASAAAAQARTDELALLTGSTWPTASVASTNIYKTYKDPNGLKRQDEMDFTLGYMGSTRVGEINFGFLHQSFANPVAKGNSFSNGGASYMLDEIFIKYAAPMLKEVSLYAGSDIIKSDQYYRLAYTKEIELGETTSLNVDTGPAYMVTERLQGWRDWTTSVSLNASGFVFGVNAALRPDLRFFDTDDSSTRPLWIDGASDKGDGRVADPSRYQCGVGCDFVNTMITQAVRSRTGNTNYNYVPRQKLPRWLYWVNFGYNTSF